MAELDVCALADMSLARVGGVGRLCVCGIGAWERLRICNFDE